MSYVHQDFKTKTELKAAVANGEKLRTYNPSYGQTVLDGEDVIEGPHYPKPHKWYARVKVEGGFVTKVLG